MGGITDYYRLRIRKIKHALDTSLRLIEMCERLKLTKEDEYKEALSHISSLRNLSYFSFHRLDRLVAMKYPEEYRKEFLSRRRRKEDADIGKDIE